MKDEYITGQLSLKQTLGGWRHYIQDGNDQHDIHCGSYMAVQLAKDKYDEIRVKLV